MKILEYWIAVWIKPLANVEIEEEVRQTDRDMQGKGIKGEELKR